MKRAILCSVLSAIGLAIVPTAEARHDYVVRDGWHDDHHDSRSIYVIENRRPVRRVVYVDDSGRYYRYSSGRRIYVTGRYFTSYPSQYYYSDGRPRVGVSIGF